MHAPSRGLLGFHEVIRSLEGLSERQQITTLKFELFQALEGESEARVRYYKLEQSCVELRAVSEARVRRLSRFAIECNSKLADATSELERVKREDEKSLQALRAELSALRAHLYALEELCRSLLQIIAQAAESVAQEEATVADASAMQPA